MRFLTGDEIFALSSQLNVFHMILFILGIIPLLKNSHSLNFERQTDLSAFINDSKLPLFVYLDFFMLIFRIYFQLALQLLKSDSLMFH